MATRKTKQDISKEDMFNKIMPSLNQKNNDDDIEEEAPKNQRALNQQQIKKPRGPKRQLQNHGHQKKPNLKKIVKLLLQEQKSLRGQQQNPNRQM